MVKKYQTEEERKAAIREASRRWREAHKEKIAEYSKQYYHLNRERALERRKQYYQLNRERALERCKQYIEAHKEEIAEQKRQYYQTPIGRARNLIGSYQQSDKKHNRGECTLTAEWIVDNIFSKSCHYCGESDWRKLGCDRIDNTKPHTEDNVVCCCSECNLKKQKSSYEEFMKKIGRP